MRRLVWLGAASLISCGGGDGGGGDGGDVAAIDATPVLDAAAPPDAAPPPPDATVPADAALQLTSCADPLPGPAHAQWIFDKVTLPGSSIQALQLGVDVDGDPMARPDNAVGLVLATLSLQGNIGLQTSMDMAVLDGTVMHLLDLESSAPSAWLLLGGDCDDPADPADNFSGEELFYVRGVETLDPPIPASSVETNLVAGPGSTTVEIMLGGVLPVRLRLHGARMQGAVATDAITNAKIGGAILEADIEGILIPAIAESLQDILDSECSGPPPFCCPAGSTGETVRELFDPNADCSITVEEIRGNDLFSFAPDVDLFDGDGNFNPRVDGVKDSFSLGVGFTAVLASFPLPE